LVRWRFRHRSTPFGIFGNLIRQIASAISAKLEAAALSEVAWLTVHTGE
jgi:hypothetical protein